MKKFVADFLIRKNQSFSKQNELESSQPPRPPSDPKAKSPLIASADVVIGKGNDQLATLAEAVERVKPDGVIYVSAGVHAAGKPIETDKPFTLVGDGPSRSIVSFQVATQDTCILIKGNGRWVVEDIALLAERALKKPDSAGDVIDVSEGGELQVTRAVLAGAPFLVNDSGAVLGGSGCRVSRGARATVTDSLIAFNHAHVCAYTDAAQALLERCTLFGGTAAALAYEGGEITLEGCEIRRNEHALHVAQAGARIVARRTKIVDQIRSGVYAELGRIELEDCSIEDCGGHGVGIDPGGQVEIRGCKIHDNWECGIAIESRAHVEGCTIADNAEHGIWIGDETSGQVRGNRIADNGLCAIIIDPESSVEVADNELEDNGTDEVYRLGSLASEVQRGFPDGIEVPEGVKQLARYQEEYGRLLGETLYVAPGPLAGWPGLEREFAVFGTGPDGSSVAFWLRDGVGIERAPIVYLDSEGVENHVLARTFEEFLAILATGRSELHHGDDIDPEIDEDDESEHEQFLEFLQERFEVKPAKSVDAIRRAAEKANPGLDARLRAPAP